MSQRQQNPLIQIATCEMCFKKVTNFVTGLCNDCHTIWTNRRRLQDKVSLNQMEAAVVRETQAEANLSTMDPTFRQVLEEEQSRQREKAELFHQERDEFQNSILFVGAETTKRFKTSNNYHSADQVEDKNIANFQYEMELLADMKTYEKSLLPDANNNTDIQSIK